MSGSCFSFLQQAVHAVLSTDAALASLGVDLHDNVPSGSALPYLVYGAASSRDASTSLNRAERVGLDLHIYSRQGGRAGALAILYRVDVLLHGANLTVSGAAVVNPRLSTSGIRQESDGLTWHATARLEALVQVT